MFGVPALVIDGGTALTYTGVDVDGKVVVVFRHTPLGELAEAPTRLPPKPPGQPEERGPR